jgi:hypothetical protein
VAFVQNPPNEHRKLTFQLSGKEHSLNRSEVEEKLRYLSPRPIDKYYILFEGRAYPPKQVLATALNFPLTSFTTIDANRILAKLGFAIQESGTEEGIERTESEVLFELYLNTSGFIDYKFGHEHPGKSKRPDFSISIRGKEYLFEIKEFRAKPQDFREGGGAYDPYGPIRDKISKAQKQFQEFRDSCCCLVLYNAEKPLVDLEWRYIFGAMLGNLGFRFPIDPSGSARDVEFQPGFTGRGKKQGGRMLHYDRQENPVSFQNTSVSAILVLEQFRIGYRRFEIELHRKERELSRKLTWEEHMAMVNEARGTERDNRLRELRVVICENPYARIPLPKELFRGPYDERYGNLNGEIQCIFVGEEIKKIEEQERDIGTQGESASRAN